MIIDSLLEVKEDSDILDVSNEEDVDELGTLEVDSEDVKDVVLVVNEEIKELSSEEVVCDEVETSPPPQAANKIVRLDNKVNFFMMFPPLTYLNNIRFFRIYERIVKRKRKYKSSKNKAYD